MSSLPSRILVVRLSALGDVIRALPVLAALKTRLPSARIGWLVEDRAATLLRGHPWIDRLHVYPRKRWQAAALRPWRWPEAGSGIRSLVAGLREERYDVSLDLQGNLKSGVLVRLAGAGRRIGFARGEGKEANHRFQTEGVAVPAGTHRMDRGLALLDALDLPGGAIPPVLLPEEDADRGDILTALRAEGLEERAYAVLHPGTSAWADFKRWPAERFGELALRLRDRYGLPSLVTFVPGEEAVASRVVAASSGAARLSPVWPRLGQLVALLRRAGLVVAADTGPAHLAAAVGTPTVTLFGPKDPALYAPYGDRVSVVWNRVSCSPCTLRHCPAPICMTTMSVRSVEAAAERLLEPVPAGD